MAVDADDRLQNYQTSSPFRDYHIEAKTYTTDKKKLEEIAATVRMPGFRPGKVPLSVVKTRFGDQARGEAIKNALDEGARQAIEGNDLKLASQPKVDIESYEQNTDLEASLACEVMPAITVPNLAKLAIEKPRIESEPKEIDDALSRMADENRPTVALKKPRAAKLGDVVTIDFIGRIDGEAFEGGTAEEHALELGSNSFIPGFEDGLVGVKTDENRDVPVTFPEDYQAAHLAGKLAVFEVTVRDIREKADATIDDELAKRLGFDDLDGLKDAIGQQINGQHATALRQLVKKNVLDALADGDNAFGLWLIHLAQVVDKNSSRIDDTLGTHDEFCVVFYVVYLNAGYDVVFFDESDTAAVVQHRSTELFGGLRQVDRQARVIELTVVVDDAADQFVLLNGRD